MPIDLKKNFENRNAHGLNVEQGEHSYSQTDAIESGNPGVGSSEFGKVIYSWEAPEFEVYEKSTRWYLLSGIFLLVFVIYALVTNSPIMAITFIMIGIVAYMQLQSEPKMFTFHITTKGVLIGKEFYPYENVISFWIFYDPPHTRTVSLHLKSGVFPFVHIPFDDDEDPTEIHAALIKFLPEIEQQSSMVDALERFLHI
jgi:hypothetical protein